MDINNITFFARYKDRYPDPGRCKVLAINWEEKWVEMTNGACRYYPKFEQIEIEKPANND